MHDEGRVQLFVTVSKVSGLSVPLTPHIHNISLLTICCPLSHLHDLSHKSISHSAHTKNEATMPTLAPHRRQTWRVLLLAVLLASLVMFNSHLFYHHHPVPVIIRAAYHHLSPERTTATVVAPLEPLTLNETIAISSGSNIT